MTRTVLVTGGAGFIGSNLARWLAARGDRVRILDDLSIGQPAYLAGTPHDLRQGSLADPMAVAEAVSGVDAVVHLAARAGIDDSVRDPLGTFEANVAWSVALLEAARLAGVRRFVFASSNAAAGDHEPPSDETDLPHPVSPYGASKLAIEAYAGAYAATYGLTACSLRFSNAYGPNSLHKRSVVAAWLRAALAGEPITIHGDGRADPRPRLRRRPRGGHHGRARRPRGPRRGRAVPGRDRASRRPSRASPRRSGGRSAGSSRSSTGRRGPATSGATSRPSTRPRASSAIAPRSASTTGWRRTAAWFKTALAEPALAGVTPHAASGSE